MNSTNCRTSEPGTTETAKAASEDGLVPVEHWLAIGFVIFAAYLFWADLKPIFGIAPAVTASSPAGTVQQVRFESGLGYDTQVDTESQSFLVSGLAGIDRNTPLELRIQDGRTVLCMATTNACWRVLGR